MTDFALRPPGIEKTADVSPFGRYRYSLTRTWWTGPRILWCMLNPSTADDEEDDPTIRRVLAFSQRGGEFGSLEVVNLYAWRATQPAALAGARDPVGPGNRAAVDAAVARAALAVAAWGDRGSRLPDGYPQIERFLRACKCARIQVVCLGKTRNGAPRHPLYVRGDKGFEPL